MRISPPGNSDIPPRTRETSAPSLLGDAYAATPAPAREGVHAQLKEEPDEDAEGSDSPIVVGDGRAVHMAKGRADGQRGQSTHAGERKVPRQCVSSTLTALNRKTVREPKHRFRDLYGLLDLQMLYTSFHRLKRNAAPGVDGVTVADYEK